MSELPFIDAHMHLWDLSHIHYPWLTPPFPANARDDVARIASTYRLDDYLAEAASWNVVGTVHVEAGAAPSQALEETDWLQRTVAERGLPSGLVAFARLDDPRVEAHLAAQAQRRSVVGVRHMVNWHRNPALTFTERDLTGDAAWARGFGLLERFDLSFDLQAYPHQFAALSRLIEAHPATRVIVDHCGMPVSAVGVDGGVDAGASDWRRAMKGLATLPNVCVKISGVGLSLRPWQERRARDRARETVDLFGPDRCLLASNFPTDRMFASFDATMNALAEAVAAFTEPERHAMFAGNANRFYRLGLEV